jgi:hypothetical protein
VDLFEKITKENKTWLALENISTRERLFSLKTEEFWKFRSAIYLVRSTNVFDRYMERICVEI